MSAGYLESVMVAMDSDEDDTCGYIVSKHPTTHQVYVHFWCGERTVKHYYSSPEMVLERVLPSKNLATYSPLHAVQYRAVEAFVKWYNRCVIVRKPNQHRRVLVLVCSHVDVRAN
jgi:hypothetical protein